MQQERVFFSFLFFSFFWLVNCIGRVTLGAQGSLPAGIVGQNFEYLGRAK